MATPSDPSARSEAEIHVFWRGAEDQFVIFAIGQEKLPPSLDLYDRSSPK